MPLTIYDESDVVLFLDETSQNLRFISGPFSLSAFTAGPEFGELEGYAMLIIKALRGIHSSGKDWATKFGAIMAKEGCKISKADPKVCMRRNGDIYEHLGSYVDDLINLK